MMSAGVNDSLMGTSPHLRGNQTGLRNRRQWQRDIPAPAGQPKPSHIIVTGPKGHPRTCGATDCLRQPSEQESGTSPHLRGNHDAQYRSDFIDGDIPAPAGQPVIMPSSGAVKAGHPRTCGATPQGKTSNTWLGGTSPHLRGNRFILDLLLKPDGDIPAPAGQPRAEQGHRPQREGHPRTCGATLLLKSVAVEPTGTSPHLRGNPFSVLPRRVGARDIPAPAGQPWISTAGSRTNWGHPRTCGATRSTTHRSQR